MKRNRVAFLKPEEPAFIRKIKQRICYEESATVDTKREQLQVVTDNDLGDRNDEKPTVDVEHSDVSKEVADNYIASIECTNEKAEKRVIFKKPVKKQGETRNATLHSTIKKTVVDRSEECDSDKRKRTTTNDAKSIKNSSLLSFNDEEDE